MIWPPPPAGAGASQLTDLSDVPDTAQVWDRFLPPATPSAYDYDWSSLQGSEFDHDANTTWSVADGFLKAVAANNGTPNDNQIAARLRTVPTEDDWEARIAVHTAILENLQATAGLCVTAGTANTDAVASCQVGGIANGPSIVEAVEYTNYGGSGVGKGSHGTFSSGPPIGGEVEVVVQCDVTGKRFVMWWSPDGISMEKIADFTVAWVPTHVGPCVNAFNGDINASWRPLKFTNLGTFGVVGEVPAPSGGLATRLRS